MRWRRSSRSPAESPVTWVGRRTATGDGGPPRSPEIHDHGSMTPDHRRAEGRAPRMTLTHATSVTPLAPPQDVPAASRRERRPRGAGGPPALDRPDARPADRLRLRPAVLPRVRRVQHLPVARHGVGVAARRAALDVRPADLGGPGQLPRPLHQPVLLERVPQHGDHRRDLDRAAAVHGARDRAPAQLPAAGPHVLPGRDPDALRDEPGRGDRDLPRALRHQARPGQLVPAPRAPARRRLAGLQVAGPDRGLDDRHLALDRLQRADLPGRHAVDRLDAVRGGGGRRCRPLARSSCT